MKRKKKDQQVNNNKITLNSFEIKSCNQVLSSDPLPTYPDWVCHNLTGSWRIKVVGTLEFYL